MRVYVGVDNREPEAFAVLAHTIRKRASCDVDITPLEINRLRSAGLLTRLMDSRSHQLYDLASNAPCSTEFAISRFLVPILAQSGFALFMDSDMVALGDFAELTKLADPRFAVQVVKHDYRPAEQFKMDMQAQTTYPRKNWSSVMLFNCDHPANRRLTVADVNVRRGFDLHQFYWLADSEIGELPAEWNWLVGVQPKPKAPKIAHFTLGGPWFKDWQPKPYDDIWVCEARDAGVWPGVRDVA